MTQEQISEKQEPERRITDFPFVLGAGAILVASGVSHLTFLFASRADWEGPLSPRKPGLFGVSAGLTLWSIAWVLTKLHPHRWDRVLAAATACGLLIEVGLITMQQWRGVPSHFNRTTTFDAAIESVMLTLILLVSAIVVWLTLRTFRLPPLDATTAIALRGGMWLLTISCGLGVGITLLGEMNLASNNPPEIWGRAGALKYPHGVALHAIQTLPLLAWLCARFRASCGTRLVRAAVGTHVLLLIAALWQTLQGRSRLDFDWLGGTLFGLAWLLLLPAVVACLGPRSSKLLRERETFENDREAGV